LSLLRELEQRLESLLEGFFTRQFKSGVQPVEIAKKLTRAMDGNRTISVSKIYVPNHYIVLLNADDAEKFRPFEKTLISEFQAFLASHAKREGYELIGRPKIEFEVDPDLLLGELAIKSILESREAGPEEAIDGTRILRPGPISIEEERFYLVRVGPGGETRILLTGDSIGIGRAPDNTIVVPDPNVSRYHARIESTAAGYMLKDLNSTNGTLINGTKVYEQSLREGDIITVGTTRLHFRRENVV